ncbi:unnamed protein product [Lampetra planeri]
MPRQPACDGRAAASACGVVRSLPATRREISRRVGTDALAKLSNGEVSSSVMNLVKRGLRLDSDGFDGKRSRARWLVNSGHNSEEPSTIPGHG